MRQLIAVALAVWADLINQYAYISSLAWKCEVVFNDSKHTCRLLGLLYLLNLLVELLLLLLLYLFSLVGRRDFKRGISSALAVCASLRKFGIVLSLYVLQRANFFFHNCVSHGYCVSTCWRKTCVTVYMLSIMQKSIVILRWWLIGIYHFRIFSWTHELISLLLEAQKVLLLLLF